MKTVELIINDNDYAKFIFGKKKVTFSEIRQRIETEFFQKTLETSVQLAKKTGLSKLSFEEINSEIEIVRKGA